MRMRCAPAGAERRHDNFAMVTNFPTVDRKRLIRSASKAYLQEARMLLDVHPEAA